MLMIGQDLWFFSDPPSLTVACANIKASRRNSHCPPECSQMDFDVRNGFDYQLENLHQDASCLVRYLSAFSKGRVLT